MDSIIHPTFITLADLEVARDHYEDAENGGFVELAEMWWEEMQRVRSILLARQAA